MLENIKFLSITGTDFFETEEPISRHKRYWWPCLVHASYNDLQKAVDDSRVELKALILLESVHHRPSLSHDESVALLLGDYRHRVRHTHVLSPNEEIRNFYNDYSDLQKVLNENITKDAIEVCLDEAMRYALGELQRSIHLRMNFLTNSHPGTTETREREPSSIATSIKRPKKRVLGVEKKKDMAREREPSSVATSIKRPKKRVLGVEKNKDIFTTETPIIDPNEKWPDVWDVMWNRGWRWQTGKGLSERIYYAPGIFSHSHPDARKNIDYFLSEDDLKEYVRKNFNWDPNGSKRSRSLSKNRTPTKKPRKTSCTPNSTALKTKKKMKLAKKDDKSETKNTNLTSSSKAVKSLDNSSATVVQKTKPCTSKKSLKKCEVDSRTRPAEDQHLPTREFTQHIKPTPLTHVTKEALEKMKNIGGEPVHRNEEWVNVWEKLKNSGWTWVHGAGLHSFLWIPPGGNRTGKEGVDYFTSSFDVKKFAHFHLGWGGDEAFWREVKSESSVEFGRRRRGCRSNYKNDHSVSHVSNRKVVSSATKNKQKSPRHALHSQLRQSQETALEKNEEEKTSAVEDIYDAPTRTNSPATVEIIDAPRKGLYEHVPASKWLHSALQSLQPSFDPTLPQNRPAVFGLPSETAIIWEEQVAEILAVLKEQIKHCNDPQNKLKNNQLFNAVLYLYGSEGTGKTMLAKMCCRNAVHWASQNKFKDNTSWYPVPAVVYINVNHLQVTTSYLSEITKIIQSELGLESDSLESYLDLRNDNKRHRLVILILDEIEIIACASIMDKKQTLQAIFDWANAPHYSLSLIGISNSIKNDTTQVFSTYSNPHSLRIINFQPYNQSQLVKILKCRVGAIIASNALEFMTQKVAATGGDASRALELARCAIHKAMEQDLAENILIPPDSTTPLVNLSHMMKVIQESYGVPHVDAIKNLPPNAQEPLQVEVTLSHENELV